MSANMSKEGKRRVFICTYRVSRYIEKFVCQPAIKQTLLGVSNVPNGSVSLNEIINIYLPCECQCVRERKKKETE